MEDCPDVPWQSGNGDQEGVDEHFVVGYRVALKKKKIFVCCKNETYLPGANFLKNSTLDVVHKLRKEGREGFREVLCKNTP